jgi:hypothetical protein
MAQNVWMTIAEICRQGLCPEVIVQPEWEIKREKQPAGRPRVRFPNDPYSHYAGYREFGKRPSCRAYRCQKFLKKNQALCCSQECLDELLSFVTDIMSRLEVKQFDEILRGVMGPDYRIFQREEQIKKRPRLSGVHKLVSKIGG